MKYVPAYEYPASLLNGSNRNMKNNIDYMDVSYGTGLSSFSNEFILVVVLFILLIIVGAVIWYYGNSKKD